jgi:hypothetical protein
MPGKLPYDRAARILWAMVLVTLPVTSFKYLPFFGKDTYVRPLSLYPLALLFPLLVVRGLKNWRKSLWQESLMPLLLFAAFALASTAVGGLFAPLDLYTQGYLGRALRAWVTLAVGFAFLLSAIWSNKTEDDLRFSVKWLLFGLVLQLTWGSVQAASLFVKFPSKKLVDAVQEIFSVRGVVKAKRISGLTFEPSWLAGQILTLYLPWLVGSILKNYHISRFRWLEAVLTALAVILALITYSRSGFGLILIVSGLTFVLAGREHLVHAWQWLTHPAVESARLKWGLRFVFAIGLIALTGGVTFVLLQSNYFSQLWRSSKDNILDYLVDINVGPRLAYVWSAWNIFQAHPLTGVGLGGIGMYMHQAFPDWSLTNIAEIAKLVSPDNRIYPNAKDLYVRLLAETGIFGFWLFTSFYLNVITKVYDALKEGNSMGAFLGTAGLFAWLGVVFYGFSQDSFAMPEIWISIGILLGVAGNLVAARQDKSSSLRAS